MDMNTGSAAYQMFDVIGKGGESSPVVTEDIVSTRGIFQTN